MNKSIIVNAPALSTSGGLTILKQFLSACQARNEHFICFISNNINVEAPSNVRLIKLSKQNWLKRIYWDSFGLKRFLKKNNFSYHVCISLQNTTVNIDVPQLIYLHQPLPFSDYDWSFFNSKERIFFLYKRFYSFFIFMHLQKSTKFVVQTNWMKRALIEKFNVKNEIFVVKPNMYKLDTSDFVDKLDSEFWLFYPATPLIYKNHSVLIKALRLFINNNSNLKIKLLFTFLEDDCPELKKLISEHQLQGNVSFLGVLSPSLMVAYYKSSDLVLFPSYIETFGLPLAESAQLSKFIICSDLPYSRDVLNNYPNVEFVDYNDPFIWAETIQSFLIDKKLLINKDAIYQTPTNGWDDFFSLIER